MNADVLFCICLALHRCPVLYSLVSPLQYCIVLYRCSALVMQVLCFVEVLVLPKQVLLFAGIETYQWKCCFVCIHVQPYHCKCYVLYRCLALPVAVFIFVQVFGLTSVNTAVQPSHTPTDSRSTCVRTAGTGRTNVQTAAKGFPSQHTWQFTPESTQEINPSNAKNAMLLFLTQPTCDATSEHTRQKSLTSARTAVRLTQQHSVYAGTSGLTQTTRSLTSVGPVWGCSPPTFAWRDTSWKGNAKLRNWISHYKQCLMFSHEIVSSGKKERFVGWSQLICPAM